MEFQLQHLLGYSHSLRFPLFHLSQETLVVLEARQSESLSELICLREALESSRLEGELLRQEQTEVTAALARVRGPPPHWWGGAGGLES